MTHEKQRGYRGHKSACLALLQQHPRPLLQALQTLMGENTVSVLEGYGSTTHETHFGCQKHHNSKWRVLVYPYTCIALRKPTCLHTKSLLKRVSREHSMCQWICSPTAITIMQLH